jgi:hypothetical protein
MHDLGNANITVGQQQWSHYKSSKEKQQIVNITDKDDNFIGGNCFDEEFVDFRPNDGPDHANSKIN